MEPKKETRLFNFAIATEKREDGTGVLTGVPIVFNQVTDMGYFTESIDENALDACDMKDVPFLVNHNLDMIPLARSRNNNDNSTMQIKVEKPTGTPIRVNLDIERNTESRNLYSAVDRGDVSGMSFMFTVDGERWEGMETDKPHRTITAIRRVYEVSAVTFPAYNQTSLAVERSAAEALESAKATLESAKEREAEEQRRNNLIAEIRALCSVEETTNED